MSVAKVVTAKGGVFTIRDAFIVVDTIHGTVGGQPYVFVPSEGDVVTFSEEN